MSDYLRYVNIRQGTDSQRRFGNGNTQPLVAVPNAMSYWAPQTASWRGNWYYHPQDRSFEGIRLTHMACNWLGDYGQMIFQPQTGEPMHDPERRWSSFRPADAVLRPDYLRIEQLRYRCVVELTPTPRCAVLRIAFRREEDEPRFAVIPFDAESEVRVEGRTIYARTCRQDWQSSEKFAMYCAVRFDCDLSDAVLTDRDFCRAGEAGKGCGINVRLSSHRCCARIGTSFLSYDQALLNLEREASRDFDSVRAAAAAAWENKLSAIEIRAPAARMRTFYSCMYRLFLFPSAFYECDRDGAEWHYCPHDGSVRRGITFVNNGFWDTARTVYPLLSLIDVPLLRRAVGGFVQIYRDSGWLPKWPSPGETGLMPGTYIDAVLADAAVKGLLPEEVLKTGYEGMLKHASEEDPHRRYGRHGTADYNRLGYLPYEKYRESTNHTLDYVYGDFCIAAVASVLGDAPRAALYAARSQNYRKLFDPAVGFIHAKDEQGRFKPDFDPIEWGGEYCEGGAWQNAFAVYHDIGGLAECYGGKDKLLAKLRELFAAPPDFNAGQYRYELHEMSEMAAVDFGQCAISNQPSFHLPYLFSALGDVGTSQYWLSKITDELFTAEADGFPGDEDTGTMAAWYIFTCLGFYPVCPGKKEFTLGRAQVRRARIRLSGGKTLTVVWDGSARPRARYNGTTLGNAVSYDELMRGGRLEFYREEEQ